MDDSQDIQPDLRGKPPADSFKIKRAPPGFAMTTAHYEYIQTLIKREVAGKPETSFWLALALAALTAVGAIWIAVGGGGVTGATHRGNLEVAAWLLLSFGVFCVGVHFVGSRRSADQRAQDIIDMMDRYNLEVESEPEGTKGNGAGG
jgi:hypothetical protein